MRKPKGKLGYKIENISIKKDNAVYPVYDKENPIYEETERIPPLKSKSDIKEQDSKKSVSFGKLFSYSTVTDRIMIFFALICSAGIGISYQIIVYLFGSITESLASFQYYLANLILILKKYNVTLQEKPPLSTVVSKMKEINPTFVLNSKYDVLNIMKGKSEYIGEMTAGVFVMALIAIAFFVITSQNQISLLRNAFYRAIMRQNVGWFDEQNSGALINKLTEDINTVHGGIGDRIFLMIQWYACGVSGVVIAFVSGWRLTLVLMAISPLIVIAMVSLSKSTSKLNQKVSDAYGKAGTVAEEVLGSIRTVVSFRGEKFETNRYTSQLDDACYVGIRKSILTGTLLGLVNGLTYGSYAIGFWYGSKLVRDGLTDVGDMLVIFFSCLLITMGLGQATPHLSSVNKARGAAEDIFSIIERVPEIDKMDKSGRKLENFKGKISFKNVSFRYPTRTDCQILKNLSVVIEPGQTAALIGPSGCGKSSMIQLIQRFYDADEGEILIDDVNIKDLNVKWLREQIGVVSQEPVLFDYSIKENIRLGRQNVTDEEIEKALIISNAKKFIDLLPKGLETLVGERGTQLSGGQKQRIAIARALVRNPKILLLDEATSALDTESEKIVQEALDKVCIGRTTVIVAHRLTTVRNANMICGIKNGSVVEKGTHNELIAKKGLYKELVERQKISQKNPPRTNTMRTAKKMEEIRKMSLNKKYSIIDKDENDDINKDKTGHFLRVLKLNGPEKWYIILGCIGAIFNGASQPAFSIIFGYLIPAIANPDLDEQTRDIQFCVIGIGILGLVVFLANVIQNVGFGQSGEKLTKRCRSMIFEAMLKQDISWFDDPENNLGALTVRLSDEASAIRGMSGESLGTFFQAIASMGSALIVSLVYCWQISLVVLAFVPVIFLGGFLQVKFMEGYSNSDKGALEESGKIAVESIENIRTVSNLTSEEIFINNYKKAISVLTTTIKKVAPVQGLLYGLTQAAVFGSYGATFVLAGYLTENNISKMSNIYISFGALIFGALYLGNSMAMAPDYGKGKTAAANMFDLLDREPPINSLSPAGQILNIPSSKGFIEVDKVKFSYPLRPDVIVMNGVSFNLEPNKTIALVGPSGCGKSTIIQLLQRFYDAVEGKIFIDKVKIEKININSLRQLFSIVSQEPTLFSYSIRENIAYADTENLYSDEQIIEAAKSSNIHDFISGLPDKYNTKVGEKGSNFSGGQKQRIAIARALLRNPKILLLDEATSALDTESEKIVQDALEKAQKGRTCLVIAHRLSTIQKADKIIVFKEGKIAETGTHNELLSKNGIYAEMIKIQSKN